MNDKVITLSPNQVWDPYRGPAEASAQCFYVGLEATKEKHRSRIVHKDKFGRRIVIVETVQ